jgi:hypothetical protein
MRYITNSLGRERARPGITSVARANSKARIDKRVHCLHYGQTGKERTSLHPEDLGMSKARPTIGTDGRALPVLPPTRDARVWARLVRVLFYTPGFLALLLIKAGEPAAFGITVELLMLRVPRRS